jgi:hypothetical protein
LQSLLVFRYITEAVEVLAALAPTLREAIAVAVRRCADAKPGGEISVGLSLAKMRHHEQGLLPGA